MAVRLTDTKTGRQVGTTYTNTDVRRMASRTGKVPGSVLRRTTGLDKVAKLQGRRASGGTRREIMAATKAGKGGFTSLARSGT